MHYNVYSSLDAIFGQLCNVGPDGNILGGRLCFSLSNKYLFSKLQHTQDSSMDLLLNINYIHVQEKKSLCNLPYKCIVHLCAGKRVD